MGKRSNLIVRQHAKRTSAFGWGRKNAALALLDCGGAERVSYFPRQKMTQATHVDPPTTPFTPRRYLVALLLCALALFGCGGGSQATSDSTPAATPLASPQAPAIDFSPQTMELSWTGVPGASSYQVVESTPSGDRTIATVDVPSLRYPGALFQKTRASYSIKACNASTCSAASAAVAVADHLDKLTAHGITSLLAESDNQNDRFGWSVVLSGDGNTLAVGANGEALTANTDGDETGRVHVYVRNATTRAWTYQTSLLAPNPAAGARFGDSVALSFDGNTLAVGSPSEDSAPADPGVEQTANTGLSDSGAVYVYKRAADGGNAWTATSFLKASNAAVDDQFGMSVALSKDGKTLAVGAPRRDAIDVNNVSLDNAGAAYVFTQSPDGQTWVQQAMVTASTPQVGVVFGKLVAISGDGGTLVVGAPSDSSTAAATDDSLTADRLVESGAAYVFARGRDSATWVQQAFLKASEAAESTFHGDAIAISNDGATIAVGAWGTSAGAAGGGNVYVYQKNPATTGYVNTASLRPATIVRDDEFGASVALSDDGTTLAVSAPLEGGGATGINGTRVGDPVAGSGAVYVFVLDSAGAWQETAYIKPPIKLPGANLGYWKNLSLSSDGATLAVGAPYANVSGSALYSGAAYVY
jgi:hypothetical protein